MKNSILFSVVIVFSILSTSVQAQTWNQAGSDLDGEAKGDQFGDVTAISDDGSRLIVGAFHNDGNGRDAGHARVFEWNGNDWIQMGSDIDGGADRFDNGDFLGYAVDISGDGSTIAVGSPRSDVTGSNAGLVRVLKWQDNSWVQVGDTIYGEEEGDFCGTSISLSMNGNVVAVGSEYFGPGVSPVTALGKVRVFEWSSGNWSEKGKGIEGENSGDKAHRVALNASGDRMAIGSLYNSDGGEAAGHLRIFEWRSGSWQQLGADIDGQSDQENFGLALAMNDAGDMVVAGAPSNATNGYNAGAVRTYKWSGSAWQMAGDVLYGQGVSDLFGSSVSMSNSGSLIAVGSPYAGYAGEASVHRLSGSVWVQMGDTVSGENQSDISGSSVALAGHGARLAIGGPHNTDAGAYSGHVRVFDYSYGVGLSISGQDQLRIFPNPSSGLIHIDCASKTPLRIELTNELGQLVRSFERSGVNSYPIQLNDLNSGIYYISTTIDGRTLRSKVMLIP